MADYRRDVEKILREHGCGPIREGRGSHTIWQSPINGRRFPVQHRLKSRNTANGILKQAGIDRRI